MSSIRAVNGSIVVSILDEEKTEAGIIVGGSKSLGYTRAKVVSVPAAITEYKVGDTVVFISGKGMKVRVQDGDNFINYHVLSAFDVFAVLED